MTHQHTEAKNHFSYKRGTLTAPLKLTERLSLFCYELMRKAAVYEL